MNSIKDTNLLQLFLLSLVLNHQVLLWLESRRDGRPTLAVQPMLQTHSPPTRRSHVQLHLSRFSLELLLSLALHVLFNLARVERVLLSCVVVLDLLHQILDLSLLPLVLLVEPVLVLFELLCLVIIVVVLVVIFFPFVVAFTVMNHMSTSRCRVVKIEDPCHL